MRLAEPTTTLTDYLLGGLAAVLAARLIAAGRGQGRAARRLWAAGFAALAVAAIAGGTSHGFAPGLAEGWLRALWKLTVYSVGVASFAFVCGAGLASLHGAPRAALTAAAVVKLGAYSTWMAGHDDFAWAVLDYGLSLAVVLALQLAAWFQRGAESSRWIVGGIVVSLVAGLVQQSGISLHRHFNHNDLYHVVQMVGLWLLYRGGICLQDRHPTILREGGGQLAGNRGKEGS